MGYVTAALSLLRKELRITPVPGFHLRFRSFHNFTKAAMQIFIMLSGACKFSHRYRGLILCGIHSRETGQKALTKGFTAFTGYSGVEFVPLLL